MSKGVGGLEVNIALLGKWCWRCLVDRESLWFKVFSSRYGEQRGRLREGGVTGSTWWREIDKFKMELVWRVVVGLKKVYQNV